MLTRVLDPSYGADVRSRLGLLTLARTTANAVFRFAPPFLATIAVGVGVSLERIGVAMAISELGGLATPLTGMVVERLQRRTALWAGLVGLAGGALLAAAVPHLLVFALALVVIGQGKAMFDLGLSAWISDRVPYERRGRVIGLTETAWALGLLVGVTALGLITAAAGWRVAYVAGAVAAVALAAALRRTLEPDPAPDPIPDPDPGWEPGGLRPDPGAIAPVIDHGPGRSARGFDRRLPMLAVGLFCLMASAQTLFVTFGTWLKDSFGLSDSQLSAVVFGLGFFELVASLGAARFADRWGKERAAAVGAAVMVPAVAALAVGHRVLVPGLVLLVVAIAAFEFAIVSAIPIGTELVAGAPAQGVAIMFFVGTLGRAGAVVPATSLYERHGMAWPAVVAAVLGCGAVAVMGWLGRPAADPAHPPLA
ncbi:MAG: MFS transporter [Acidimicrobiales bacterium]